MNGVASRANGKAQSIESTAVRNANLRAATVTAAHGLRGTASDSRWKARSGAIPEPLLLKTKPGAANRAPCAPVPKDLCMRSDTLRLDTLRVGLAVVFSSVLLLSGAAGAQEAPESPERGAIVREAVNPYRFRPDDSAVRVDAATTDVKGLFEDLGPDAIEWYQHVLTLSNPWFEGRAPGTEGHERAAEYLAWWMQQIGLTPAFGSPSDGADASFLQPFNLTGKDRQVSSSSLTIDGKGLKLGKDYAVMGSSGPGAVTSTLAFAGYAIAAGEEGYTSFDGDDDLSGRVVLFMRYEPLDAEGKSKWGGHRWVWANLAGKLQELSKRGAAAIIMVTPPGVKEAKSGLEDLRRSRWGAQLEIPFVQITTEQADALLRKADPEGRDLLTLRTLCDEGKTKDFALKNNVRVTVSAEVSDGTVPATNVGGVLAGRGALKDDWVVIGGHFDHVGYGYFGSDPALSGQLHPGADDNASGTAGVLLVARQMKEAYDAAPVDADLRSVLFLAFSAEESGLDGSKFFVKNPTIPAERLNVMLNMDMIGRLRSDTLSVGGYDSAVDFGKMLDPVFAASGMEIRADPSGRGPSDHASFYGVGVPVLFFFTGTHDVYHRPGDKGYTVNPAGAMKVVSLVREVAMKLASDPTRLTYKSTDGAATPDRGYAGVRLGVRPGMGEEEEMGVLVESVSAETSAAEAGIQSGDLLVLWDGKELTGAGDMMARLREHKPGDRVKILLRRDGKEQEVLVTLKASKPRG